MFMLIRRGVVVVESSLKLIVPENFEDFGKKVNNHINKIRNTKTNYIVDLDLVRFNNGEGKSSRTPVPGTQGSACSMQGPADLRQKPA